MPRKIINDIIPKKSIRQIPISLEKKPVAPKVSANYREKFHVPKVKGNRKALNPKFAIWLIALVALLALFFGVSLIFSKATLSIKPRLENIVFNNETYTAKLDAVGTSTLAFEVLKLDKVDSLAVEATEEKAANQKASGQIVIYNNYSSATQRLINNTRFEATNGKIYRLGNSVDVPGTKVVGGKTVPGSAEAVVYADQAGVEYNMKLADLTGDFKIPGFKGSPRYDSFYARLKTDITGGLIGKQKIVAEAVRQTAEEALKSSLKGDLLKELYSVKPDNYTVFNNSYTIDYVTLPDTALSDNKVEINMKANLNSVVFNNVKLANYIGRKKIADFDNLPANLIFADDLVTTLVGKDSINLWQNSTIDVRFSGPAQLKWFYDSDQIKKDLAGQKATDLVQILSKYKAQVSSIQVSFSPVWSRYFPDNLNRIKILELD